MCWRCFKLDQRFSFEANLFLSWHLLMKRRFLRFILWELWCNCDINTVKHGKILKIDYMCFLQVFLIGNRCLEYLSKKTHQSDNNITKENHIGYNIRCIVSVYYHAPSILCGFSIKAAFRFNFRPIFFFFARELLKKALGHCAQCLWKTIPTEHPGT